MFKAISSYVDIGKNMQNPDAREQSIASLLEICDNGSCKTSFTVVATALTGDTSLLGCDLLKNVYDS